MLVLTPGKMTLDVIVDMDRYTNTGKPEHLYCVC